LDQPADAVGDLHFVEIDEPTERPVEQFHVAEEVGFANVLAQPGRTLK
jgi:hypothetical protein